MNEKEEKQRFRRSFIQTLFVLFVFWIVKISETSFQLDLSQFGILPRNLRGLIGLVFAPFIHGDYEHLWANSAAFLVLGFFILYFYPKVAWKSILYCMFLGNILLWIGGRQNIHIGASGVIYSIAAFLITSGFISKYYRLIAVSLIVVFLYGSLIWGILPINPQISWEGHLFGMISGIIFAVYYRKEAPKRPEYKWENESGSDHHYIEYFYKPPKKKKPKLIDLIKKTRDRNLEKYKGKNNS